MLRSKIKRYSSLRNNEKALAGMFTTVSPTSKHPSTYAHLPEDTDDWNCAHWKDYYLRNKAIIGKAAALLLFEQDIDSIGTFASGQACKYDCEFMRFFESEGLKGGNFFSKAYCAVEGATDVVVDTVDTVGGVADFTKWIANNKTIIITGLGLAGYMYYKYKK